jgi:diguanylate cyclase (GGDEF)-like protein
MANPLKARWERLESAPVPVGVAAAAVLILLVGWVDFLVGRQTELTLFYLVAVGTGSWIGGFPAVLVLSGLAAAASSGAVILGAGPDVGATTLVWSGLHSFAVFALGGYISTLVRRGRERRQELALVDPLTELPNSSGFFEQAERIVKTAVRYSRPVTVAYIGVDHFDHLNARFGHQAGDDVLISISRTLRQQLRETDLVARIGGDEFGLVLPEAGLEAGRAAMVKVRENLLEATDGWSIGFSIGAIACDRTPCALDELLRRAEGVMRQVKQEGRNEVRIEEI